MTGACAAPWSRNVSISLKCAYMCSIESLKAGFGMTETLVLVYGDAFPRVLTALLLSVQGAEGGTDAIGKR